MKTTVLIQKHKDLGAKIGPFSGWQMPIQYEGIVAEHNWTRDNCSIFDICHMGEFIIDGTPDETGLNDIVTVNLDTVTDKRCHYAFMLNEKGGIIDDVVIYKIKNDKWMLVVNAATAETDKEHLRTHLRDKSCLEDISDKTAKIDLQGPLSQEVLIGIAGDKISGLRYYSFDMFSLLGDSCIISRTGYTGELGYEIYINIDKAEKLWSMLLDHPKVKPAGLGARDTLRLEMCYPLYGQDINTSISPCEANLDKFVDFSKNFIGKDALTEREKKGATKKLTCFMSESRRSPRHDNKIYNNDQEIGVVTSGSFSPSLSCGIGMGYIKPAFIKMGASIVIKSNTAEIKAVISPRPFYKEGSVKA